MLEDFEKMAKRNVDHELDQFLDRHGYNHSRRKVLGAKKPGTAQPPPVSSRLAADPVDLVNRTTAEMEDDGRFGNKVFIAAIWDKIGSALDMSLPEFKSWLLEQNRRGSIILARADMVGAMDPQMVKRSEFQDRGATFHVVMDRNFSY